jgi:hypothetical protein
VLVGKIVIAHSHSHSRLILTRSTLSHLLVFGKIATEIKRTKRFVRRNDLENSNHVLVGKLVVSLTHPQLLTHSFPRSHSPSPSHVLVFGKIATKIKRTKIFIRRNDLENSDHVLVRKLVVGNVEFFQFGKCDFE